MRLSLPTVAAGLLLASVPCFASVHPHRASGSTHATIRHASLKGRHAVTRTAVARTAVAAHHDATPAIDTDRATQIQTALIQRGYMTGEPTGKWDANSIAAMQKMQEDNGWQTKFTPDARALNKLGLGSQPQTN